MYFECLHTYLSVGHVDMSTFTVAAHQIHSLDPLPGKFEISLGYTGT